MTRVLMVAPVVSAADSLADLARFAQAAEAAGFDILRLQASPGFDPLSAAAALASMTTRIGLCAAAFTGVGEPYTLARGFAALDHLSGGRAAWEILPARPSPLPDFVHREPPTDEGARAREFVEAACALWDSWAPDAVLHDKAEARFSNPARIRRVDYEGQHIHVRGPLNTPRPPQGRPLLVVGGSAPKALIELSDIVLSAKDEALVLPLSAIDHLQAIVETNAPAPGTPGGLLRARLGFSVPETWA